MSSTGTGRRRSAVRSHYYLVLSRRLAVGVLIAFIGCC